MVVNRLNNEGIPFVRGGKWRRKTQLRDHSELSPVPWRCHILPPVRWTVESVRSAGYQSAELMNQASRARGMLVRRSLFKSFLDRFPGQLEEIRATRRFRALL